MGERGPQPSEKTLQIAKALEEGKRTYQEIGDEFGVSKQWVGLIADRYSLARRKPLDSILAQDAQKTNTNPQ